MSAPTLDLNEPARSLFRQTVAVLEQWLPPVLPPGTSWCIGGGTVLAAQWQHRLSTDIDIFLPGGAGIVALHPQWNSGFVKAMEAHGATRVDALTHSLKFTLPSGRVEITALDHTPPLEPNRVRIDGHEVKVLPNACILAGKLTGRGMEMPARDVFDVCVGAHLDPLALRCAVNQMSAQMRPEVAARLLESERRYVEDAPRQILDPAPQWEHFLVEGPRRVVEIMDGLAYRRVDLSYAGGAAFVIIETNDGEAMRWTFQAPQEILVGLYEIGLEEWVLGNYGTINAFLVEAEHELASSRNDGDGDGSEAGKAGGPQ